MTHVAWARAASATCRTGVDRARGRRLWEQQQRRQQLGQQGTERADGGTVAIEVTQPEPAYRLPIEIAVESQNNLTRHRVLLDGTRQQITLTVPTPSSSLGFDPDDWVLKESVRWEASDKAPGSR